MVIKIGKCIGTLGEITQWMFHVSDYITQEVPAIDNSTSTLKYDVLFFTRRRLFILNTQSLLLKKLLSYQLGIPGMIVTGGIHPYCTHPMTFMPFYTVYHLVNVAT